MPEVAPQFSSIEKPPIKLTSVGVNCDPNCKWKKAIANTILERDLLKETIPTEPFYGNIEDIRPTKRGYDELRTISVRYAGADVLLSTAEQCDNPCAVERLVDNPNISLGSEIIKIINDLR